MQVLQTNNLWAPQKQNSELLKKIFHINAFRQFFELWGDYRHCYEPPIFDTNISSAGAWYIETLFGAHVPHFIVSFLKFAFVLYYIC